MLATLFQNGENGAWSLNGEDEEFDMRTSKSTTGCVQLYNLNSVWIVNNSNLDVYEKIQRQVN